MANSLSFGGVDLSTYGLTVLNSPYTLVVGTDLELIRIPNSNRSIAPEPFASPRRWSIDCIVLGTSYQDLTSKLGNISATLGKREQAALSFDSIAGRYWLAYVSGEVEVTINGSVARLTIPFVAPDPYGYATAGSTATVTYPSETELLPAVLGTARVYPVLEYIATEAVSDIVIEAKDVDMRVGWGGTLATGNRVIFDCENWIAYWSADGGSYVPSMATVTGEFPFMIPGINNIRMISPASGTLTATWTDRYL